MHKSVSYTIYMLHCCKLFSHFLRQILLEIVTSHRKIFAPLFFTHYKYFSTKMRLIATAVRVRNKGLFAIYNLSIYICLILLIIT